MYERKLPVEVECGLNLFMEIMSGKWKIKLIWCIYSGICRPADLQRKIPNASRRLLDTQLKQLEEHGILAKIRFDQLPLKVEYSLTPLGLTLIPVIEVTAKWGEDHRSVLEPLLTADNISKAGFLPK